MLRGCYEKTAPVEFQLKAYGSDATEIISDSCKSLKAQNTVMKNAMQNLPIS